MLWLPLTLIGYFLNAFAIFSDKFLLSKALPHPGVYTFYATAPTICILFLLPFAPGVPALPILLLALVAGATFTLALYLSYLVLQTNAASEASPVVGSLVPAFVLLLAWMILGDSLTPTQLVAFAVILVGSVAIIHDVHGAGHERPRADVLMIGGAAAFLFALSQVLAKFVYLHGPFLNGLIWRTTGAALASLVLLASGETRRYIFRDADHTKPKAGALFILGKIAGGGSFVFLNYAFTIGSIAIVNALVGVQYIFLYALLAAVAYRFPGILHEHLTGQALARKLMSLVLLSVGVGLLFM